ncbi:MAG: hypothetical protein LAO03_18750 [Acidobacteriia bacterium]|nr:hypothetical protein [Terriglobia bacterium]
MAVPLTGPETKQLIREFSAYIQQQRDSFFPESLALSPRHKEPLEGFFSSSLLEKVRIVQLQGNRIPLPVISLRDRISQYVELPDIAHMNSFTFWDVLVFQDPITERRLFHGLVHAVQLARLGLETYLELYIRAFLKTGKYLTVPLEVQAFRMDARFSEASADRFKVEEEVELWLQRGLYQMGAPTPETYRPVR